MRYGYKEGSTKSDDTVGYNVMCNAFPTVVSVLTREFTLSLDTLYDKTAFKCQ